MFAYVKIVATVVLTRSRPRASSQSANASAMIRKVNTMVWGAIQPMQKYARVADMVQVPGTQLSILTLSWSFGLYICWSVTM